MMAAAVACSVLIAWVLGAALIVRAFHVRAWRIEFATLPTSEQAYRLQRLMFAGVAGTGGYAVLGFAAVIATSIAVDGPPGSHWFAVAVAVLGVPSCVLPVVATVRVVRRSYARVRDVAIRAHGRPAVLISAVAITALVTTGIAVGRTAFPRHGIWHVAGLLSVYLVVLVALQLVLAPLLVVSLRARPLPDETRLRLRRLAVRMGVRVRDIRVIPGRAQRLANAAQIGAVPGLNYIVVTDYLLDQLHPDEVDAVVAHELGHLRGRHLAVKLLGVFGVWVALEAVFATLTVLTGASAALLLLIPVLIAFPLGLPAVQRVVGVRLEQRADDAAARTVGGARLAMALEAISVLNSLASDGGRTWALLTQHPGLDERLRRLRRRVPATYQLVGHADPT